MNGANRVAAGVGYALIVAMALHIGQIALAARRNRQDRAACRRKGWP